MTFALPMPPSINTYWATAPKTSRRIISLKGRTYRRDVLKYITVNRAQRRIPFAPLAGRLRMTLTFHYTDRRAYDLDNYPKSVQDALQQAEVFANDSQIDALHLLRGAVQPGNGQVIVVIEEIGHA